MSRWFLCVCLVLSSNMYAPLKVFLKLMMNDTTDSLESTLDLNSTMFIELAEHYAEVTVSEITETRARLAFLYCSDEGVAQSETGINADLQLKYDQFCNFSFFDSNNNQVGLSVSVSKEDL